MLKPVKVRTNFQPGLKLWIFFLPRLLAKNENPKKEYKTHPFLHTFSTTTLVLGKKKKAKLFIYLLKAFTTTTHQK